MPRTSKSPIPSEVSELSDRFMAQLASMQENCIAGFAAFFEKSRPAPGEGPYLHAVIHNWDSLKAITSKAGLYIIASDFPTSLPDQEKSSLTINGLPVIYRGHSNNIRERLQSHLSNSQYRDTKKQAGNGTWDRCMKLSLEPGDGGIDCHATPYDQYRWEVLILPIGSTKQFREFAEWGFDRAFGRPIASVREKTIAPAPPAP